MRNVRSFLFCSPPQPSNNYLYGRNTVKCLPGFLKMKGARLMPDHVKTTLKHLSTIDTPTRFVSVHDADVTITSDGTKYNAHRSVSRWKLVTIERKFSLRLFLVKFLLEIYHRSLQRSWVYRLNVRGLASIKLHDVSKFHVSFSLILFSIQRSTCLKRYRTLAGIMRPPVSLENVELVAQGNV